MDTDFSLIIKYFPDLSLQQQNQLLKLKELYTYWNVRINVISRKDIDALYERHVLHSLAIARFISFRSGTKIMDVGTGGGLPGIPLAILFPESQFLLVDSIGKKVKVVNAIAEELELKNVQARQVRAEEVKEKFDFVVSRAVTAFPVFYGWVKDKILPHSNNVKKNGLICLKGGDLTEELTDFQNKVTVISLQGYFEEAFFETKKLVYLPTGVA